MTKKHLVKILESNFYRSVLDVLFSGLKKIDIFDAGKTDFCL